MIKKKKTVKMRRSTIQSATVKSTSLLIFLITVTVNINHILHVELCSYSSCVFSIIIISMIVI
jgi:hypothetical protein